MNVVTVYFRIYAECLGRALTGISKNLWTLLLPIGLSLSLGLLMPLLGALGFVGGILVGLAIDAAISCYLYFTGEVVAHARVGLQDFKKSIGAYFWSIMNLFFIFWLARLVVGVLSAAPSAHQLLSLALNLLIAVMLNPAPEVIYQRGTYGGMETISQSFRFMQENWVEWLIPSVLSVALFYFMSQRVFDVAGGLALWAWPVVLGALAHVLMVFRGHLFATLQGSTHRQRMFRFRSPQ